MKKTALITGASGDIGSSIATEFAKNGYNLLLHYNRDKNSCEKLREKLENEYKIAVTLFQANFENESEVEGIAQRVRLENGGVDVLVNNAGVSLVELFQYVDNAAAARIMSVNLQNTMLLTQKILPLMINQKSGCIINVSSMWGMVGASMEVHYSATKAGIIGMTKALAKEVGLSGVRVNCICPGLIEGKMNSHLNAEDIEGIVGETPLGRIGTAQDVANLVSFLASDKASFITGQVIAVDGGYC